MQLMHKHRLERVLVVNDDFELRGLITVKDILKSSEHPNACKDEQGKLRVGAAVGVGEGTEERVAALVEAGVDVHRGRHRARPRAGRARPRASGSRRTSRRSRSSAATSPPPTARRRWSTTAPTASRSASARARSAPRASSPASACRRSPRSSNVAEALRRHGRAVHRRRRHPLLRRHRQGDRRRRALRDARRPVRRHRGVARRDRALPGPLVQVLPRHGLARRDAAGLGRPLLPGRRRRTSTSWCPRASRAACRTRAAWSRVIHQLIGGLRASMGYTRLRHRSRSCARRAEFVEITSAGMRESHVHDVQIMKEAPNYHMD